VHSALIVGVFVGASVELRHTTLRVFQNSQCGSVGARVILMDGRGDTMCRDWSGRSEWSSLQGVPVPQLLPREYSGPRHIVKVGQRPDGRCEYEERLGPPPPDHVEDQDPNVIRLYLVRAHDAADEIDCATDLAGKRTATS
jgi:hypothetical protein